MKDSTELSKSIIGAAIDVLNKLKPGLDEKLYENALVVALTKTEHLCEQQRAFDVYYENVLAGRLIPDLIVDQEIVCRYKGRIRFQRIAYFTNARLSEYYWTRNWPPTKF